MAQIPSLNQLQQVLSLTLSPDENARKQAEKQLLEAEKIPGYPIQVLHVVANNTANEPTIRLAAAVHFKNIVRKGWNFEDEVSEINISQGDRETMKNNLVELMCSVPPQIKAQCSESICLIANVDFPTKWPNLLPELVQKFGSTDINIVQGVLMTTAEIAKRFPFVERNDELYRDLAYVLSKVQQPLLILFKSLCQQVSNFVNDRPQLEPRVDSLSLVCSIFYSLNWQDLPEYFEDHMGEWMEGFASFLKYENNILVDNDEEDQPSSIDKLQTAIIEILTLYANKDEEPFLPFLPNFTSLVWNLLMKTSLRPKHDALATTSIRFLSSLVSKQMHRDLFKEKDTLNQIISNIVVVNLQINEADEERFEDDPMEYILRDMEGGETISRRKCSQEMLRAMCRQFETETTSICLELMTKMANEYISDPVNKWPAKDTAINLLLGVAVKAQSIHGVSSVNENINLIDFFKSQIIPEIQDTNYSLRPLVKATCIGFVSTFRNQFSKEELKNLLPLLINHLQAESIVIHSYASSAIEKVLTTKIEGIGLKSPKLSKEDLSPFLESLFTGLFHIIGNLNNNENEYAMKCVMRSLSLVREDIMPVTQQVIEQLTSALGRVARNPRNPQYNHYLFESIAVLIRSVCAKEKKSIESFETLLFPPFQTVLQMDVVEFVPYVFQIFAQILEYRTDLGAAYNMLFPPLLTPALWERKGNIPAITRLLGAYLQVGGEELVSKGNLAGILGVFQKLLSARSSEVCAFELLNAIVLFVPMKYLQEHLKTLFQVLLTRLQHGKTSRFVRLITQFFSLFIGKFGASLYLDLLNSLQPGVGLLILYQVWLPRLQSDLPVRLDAKIHVIGLTRLMVETPALLDDTNGQQVWCQTLFALMQIISSANAIFNNESSVENDFEVNVEYDSAYSKLHFASHASYDPYADIKDLPSYIVKSLSDLSATKPGKLPSLISQSLQANPKLSSSFENMLNKSGLKII